MRNFYAIKVIDLIRNIKSLKQRLKPAFGIKQLLGLEWACCEFVVLDGDINAFWYTKTFLYQKALMQTFHTSF